MIESHGGRCINLLAGVDNAAMLEAGARQLHQGAACL